MTNIKDIDLCEYCLYEYTDAKYCEICVMYSQYVPKEVKIDEDLSSELEYILNEPTEEIEYQYIDKNQLSSLSLKGKIKLMYENRQSSDGWIIFISFLIGVMIFISVINFLLQW